MIHAVRLPRSSDNAEPVRELFGRIEGKRAIARLCVVVKYGEKQNYGGRNYGDLSSSSSL
jgi:hypothetical protein